MKTVYVLTVTTCGETTPIAVSMTRAEAQAHLDLVIDEAREGMSTLVDSWEENDVLFVQLSGSLLKLHEVAVF